MKAVIAAGGLKSRHIHPVRLSKALFPVANKPGVFYTLETLSEAGISEAFLAIGNNEVESVHFSSDGFNGLSVRTVVEDYPRGTAGCLKQVEENLNGHTVVLIAASLVFFAREDLEEMIRFHRETGADLTVGLMPAAEGETDTERVILGPDSEVDGVVQIHSSMNRRSNLKTSGIYVMESHVLGHVNPMGFVDMKEQLLPKLRSSGLKMVGWSHKRYSSNVRTMGDYLRINFELLKNYELAKRHLRGYEEIKSQIWVGRNVHISPSATLVRPLVVGDDARIDENATVVGPSVIGDRCVLERNSFIRESIFWPDSTVGANFEVEKCLVSGKAFSSENSHCREMIVLDGECYLDGISAMADGTVIRKVVRRQTQGWARLREKAYPILKRLFDVVLSTIFLILSAPLFALIALAVKLDSRGPVFFIQTRCGKNAKPFRMIKFRSMVKDAEELRHTVEHLNRSDGPMFKIFDDPRETRVGRFLRASNLDELPQLINVLRGQMSLVGPRPLSMGEMKYNPHWRDARLQVMQGITGLWQIKGKDTHFFHDWIRYDLKYADERSMWLDIKIIFLTLLKVLKIF